MYPVPKLCLDFVQATKSKSIKMCNVFWCDNTNVFFKKNCKVLMQPYVSLLTVIRISRERKHLLKNAPYALFSYLVLWTIIYAHQAAAGLSCFSWNHIFSLYSKLKHTDRWIDKQTDRQKSRQTETGNIFLLLYKMIFNNKNFQTILLIDLYIFIHPFTLNYKHIKKDKHVRTSS